jgi:site-specific recombinase XerD
MVTYAEAVERWLQRLANEGRSPRTLAAYRADLDSTMTEVAIARRLVAGRAALARLDPEARSASVLAAFEQLDLTSIGVDDLDEALATWRTRPDPRFAKHPERAPASRSNAAVARRTASVRSFFSWCYRTKRIEADPAALLTPPPRPARVPRDLDLATAGRVLDESDAGSAWPERDAVIVSLALGCGLRLDEIARLRLVDLTGDPPTHAVVVGKGGKERRVPLAPWVQEAITDYLPTRRRRLDGLAHDAATLVVTSRPRAVRGPAGPTGKTTMDGSRDSVAYVIDRVLRRLGVRRPGIRVHALRHTFATLGLRDGAFNLRQLQELLGHASLATTQIYTRVGDEELAAAVRLHPLARPANRGPGVTQ